MPDSKRNNDQAAPSDGSAEPVARDTEPTPFNPKVTLPTGASFSATWKLPSFRPPSAGSGQSGVRRLELPRGDTLRLDLGLPTPPADAPQRPGAVQAVSVRQIGGSGEASERTRHASRSTDPLGHLLRAPLHAEPPAHEPPAHEPPAHEPPAHEPPAHERDTWRPRARRRPSTASLLLTGLFAGAAAGTLLLLFADDLAAPRSSDAITVEHEAVNPHVVTKVAPAPAAEPAEAAAANLTLVTTQPPGAELVANGAVIANTPARIERASYEVDLLVRLAGHQPQLIRVGPTSPSLIAVTLEPVAKGAP